MELSIDTKHALLSVQEKNNIEYFAEALIGLGYKIIATKGTEKYLCEKGVKGIIALEELVGSPKMGVRGLKVVSREIFAGIYADRNSPDDQKDLILLNTPKIDLVCCNFYQFSDSLRENGSDPSSMEKVFSHFDVGGPGVLVRTAVKKHKYTIVVTDPSDYKCIIDEILYHGDIDKSMRLFLATKAWTYLMEYDGQIHKYLQSLQERKLEIGDSEPNTLENFISKRKEKT